MTPAKRSGAVSSGRNVITVLDYIARGIGWPVLLLVVLVAVAAFGVFVAAGVTGFVPTLQAVLGVP